MKIPMPDEKIAYEAIKNLKDKFGVFHKTCFHIHTPESYDFKLKSDWSSSDYMNASDREIFAFCIEQKVFPEGVDFDSITLNDDLSDFKSKKELFSFMLLAETIMSNNIEIVLVTDHQTINGIKKLKTAVDILQKMKKYKIYPEILLGIEISCADKNHIVGIFEDDVQNIAEINRWLDENILSVEDGSFKLVLKC